MGKKGEEDKEKNVCDEGRWRRKSHKENPRRGQKKKKKERKKDE